MTSLRTTSSAVFIFALKPLKAIKQQGKLYRFGIAIVFLILTTTGISRAQTKKGDYFQLVVEGKSTTFEKSPSEVALLAQSWRANLKSSHDILSSCVAAKYYPALIPVIAAKLDSLYAMQSLDGRLPDSINQAKSPSAINPPLYTWAEWQLYLYGEDRKRLGKVISTLERHHQFVSTNRKHEVTEHGLYWTNRNENWLSNYKRFPETQGACDSLAGGFGAWVDMSTYLANQSLLLSKIHTQLGNKEKADSAFADYQRIKSNINQWMWSNPKGLYLDVDDAGNQSRGVSPAAFLPMIAEIPTRNQIKQLAVSAKNQSLLPPFWLSKDLSLLHYLTLVGFIDCQETTLASQMLNGLLAGKPLPSISNSVSLGSIIEVGLGLRVKEDGIHWAIQSAKRQGIENMRIGERLVTILAKERVHDKAPVLIEATTSEPIRLHLYVGGRYKNVVLKKGKNSIQF